jgi:TetR/AcrR family transcriptional regulator, transcriptional repressor of bet genes
MPGQKAAESERREQILEAAYTVALRKGLESLTVRAVAASAGLSHGLVLFHFKRKDQLVRAVLDRVLANTLSLEVDAAMDLPEHPAERLPALLRREVDRLTGNAREVRLLLEYWALGAREPTLRAKVGAALDRYRAAFRRLTEEMLLANPDRLAGVTPAGLTAVAVSFINGCAVQALIDPDRFDVEEYLAAVQGILGSGAPPRGQRRAAAEDTPARTAV